MYRPRIPRSILLTLLTLGSLILAAAPLAAAPAPQASSTSLQRAFSTAAREFGVPESVLLAVSYNVSRWEQHDGRPSTTGGYGVMHLTQVNSLAAGNARGDDVDRSGRAAPNDPSLHTLDRAAALLNVSPEALKRDPAQNIRGGAALLAQYARETVGRTPASEADWYGAVVKYSGSEEASVALDFANTVYATMQQGAARTTNDGQAVKLNGQRVQANTRTAANVPLRNNKKTGVADCPNGLECDFIPAAYQQNSSDPGDYGNYDLANRERDGLDIRYIVIHDTEVDYAGTIGIFTNPLAYVSSHYVLRASDGHVTQMVENKNVAWHAGNWYINAHSIGLEHEGFAIEGAAWYSEQLYHASAKLVRYLAEKYDIPLDRAHIIGHDDIPHPTQLQQVMHWDPGPFWDWAHYMRLIGAPINPSKADRNSNIITINPNFNTNVQTVIDCEGDESRLTQSVSFVYLRTAPSFGAPYVTNPYLTDGPLCANNWGDKAATGQQFYRFAQQGDWTGIYFGGGEAWFYNPRHNANSVPGSGMLITPKAGLASIPVYGRAYPEASAYPPDITPQAVVPIGEYSIPAGQKYVAFGPYRGDYYYAPIYNSPEIYRVVQGSDLYYQIFFNHRFAFVRASDVDVIAGR